MNKKAFKEDIFPILFLTIVVCIAVVGLTMTNSFTKDKIAENKVVAIQENLAVLFTDMDEFEFNDTSEVYTILKANNTIGYAFECVGQGYGGDISIMVGLQPTSMANDDIVIHGIAIVEAAGETPGLGQKITKYFFIEQFEGTNANDVYITKDGGRIDAISGATISSVAVVSAVHDAAIEKAQFIREGGI